MRSNPRYYSLISLLRLLFIILITSLACNLPFISSGDETTPVLHPTGQPTLIQEEQADPEEQVSSLSTTNPAAVLVQSQNSSHIRMLDLQGNLLDELDLTQIGEQMMFQAIAGNSADGRSIPPLILRDIGNGLLYYYEGGNKQMLNWDSTTASVQASGSKYLAITGVLYKDNGVANELYVTSGAKLGSTDPVYFFDGSGEEWLVLTPLSLEVENNQPEGVWYTLALTGVGGDILYPLQHSLYYLDIETGQSREVLGSKYSPNSLSADRTWVVLTAFQPGDPFLKLRNLESGEEIDLPLDPGSDRGAGFTLIAPDNGKVAWMEAKGTLMSLEPDLTARLRIADMDGNLIHDFDGDMIANQIGAQQIAKAAPVAWLDANTLLVSAMGYTDDVNYHELLIVDSANGSITHFSMDYFLGVVYLGQNDPFEESQMQSLTSIPDASLSMSGPWVVLPSKEHMWAVNLDGSGLTSLINQGSVSWYVQKVAAAPNGGNLAFTASWESEGLQGLTLFLLKLPEMTMQTITELTSPSTAPPSDPQVCDPGYEAVRAATVGSGLAWSPDGRMLAFVGVQEGPTSDLYVYSLDTGEIEHVTDGPSQAYDPVWSPDGKYIIHFGASCFGTGAGFNMVGAWAASPDGADVFSLYDIDPGIAGENVVGWLSDEEVVVETLSGCPAQNLRKVNLSTRTVTTIYEGCYFDSVMAEDRSLALTVDSAMAADGIGGTYIFPFSGDGVIQNPDLTGYELSYSAEYGAFFLLNTDWVVRSFDFSASPGALFELNALPVFSPSGSWWAADPMDGLVIGGETNSSPRLIFPGVVLHPFWTHDSATGQETLLFFGGEDFDHMGLYVTYPPTFEILTLNAQAFPLWSTEPVWVAQ